MNILDKIVTKKRAEVASKEQDMPVSKLVDKSKDIRKIPRVFFDALNSAKPTKIIAEIKRRSPSKGIIRENLNPASLAQLYESCGASAISVLTDNKFFGGSVNDLIAVRKNTTLPVLYKEFVISEYQIYEALLSGADAILLIARILDSDRLAALKNLADRLGLDSLVEIHTEEDITKTLKINAEIIGINNRNLDTFTVNLDTFAKMTEMLPKTALKVCESGVFSTEDIKQLKLSGADAFLIGEALLKEKNPGEKLSELIRG